MPGCRRAALLLVWLQQRLQLGSCSLTDVEKEYIAVPLANGARESLKFITSKPHVAGTPGDHEVNAEPRSCCKLQGWLVCVDNR